ncbi:hypothetical protein DENIT_12824 [Pseudomonas veronii]|nr:hypothetical protein DENIT_12824 [Pseudomonas veronii]
MGIPAVTDHTKPGRTLPSGPVRCHRMAFQDEECADLTSDIFQVKSMHYADISAERMLRWPFCTTNSAPKTPSYPSV